MSEHTAGDWVLERLPGEVLEGDLPEWAISAGERHGAGSLYAGAPRYFVFLTAAEPDAELIARASALLRQRDELLEALKGIAERQCIWTPHKPCGEAMEDRPGDPLCSTCAARAAIEGVTP